MSDYLKSQTIRGVGWSAIERFSTQGVTFFVQIILARLLSPRDYGIIGMLAVFIQIAQVFVDSGFANALIQKKECNNKDYSTVFYLNLGISVLFFFILFVCAPYIALFYNEPILEKVTRVLSITLLLNAIPIVPRTILVKKVDFRSQSYISLIGAVLSGAIGIYLAYKGFGVWALVWQQISNSIIQLILYFIVTHWWPAYIFSKQSFRELFSFGSKLLASSLISSLYKNLYSIIIGKKFSSVELGYYTRAEQIAMFPSSNLGNIIGRVAYPVFSKIQDDNEMLCNAYRKMIRLSSFIIFPLMVGLIALAEPFIICVLTDKWQDMTIILQILCLDWMLDHLSILNLNLLFVKGRSDLALRLEIIKKVIAVVILIITLPFGLVAMCWGRVLYSVIATLINSYYTKSLIGLSIVRQLNDIKVVFVLSLVMGVIVYAVNMSISNSLLQLIVGFFVGAFSYSVMICLFSKSLLAEVKGLKRNKI